MTLGLFPEETNNALDALGRMPPAGPPQPGFFAGVAGAIPSGIEEGAVKSAFALTPDKPTAPQNIGMPPIGAPDWAYEKYEQSIKKAAETDPEQFKQQLAQDTTEALKRFAPDPRTTGTAAQILHGVASGATRLVAGALVAGPVGGAVAVGGSEGIATTRSLKAEGVDENTANALGAGAALFSGAGALLPGGMGTTAIRRIASGAAIQTEVGIYQRGLTHNVLEDAGYTAQAQQYKALDGQQMMADGVLGAAFGGVHHLFAPSEIDAALTARGAVHREIDTAPGIPATPDARQLHVEQLTQAARQMMNDEPVSGMRMPDTIQNPAQDALGAAMARELGDASREVTDEVVGPEAPEFAGPERRADAVEASRLAELSYKHQTEGLSPAETTEWANLLNKRRLSTQVGGRTIRSVGSYEAYREMLARGEGKAVVGFADSDMLHATNKEHGYPVGDELIRATGETLSHYFGEGNVFRRSGEGGGSDEFLVHADTPEAYDAAMAAAQQHLENHTLRAYDPVTGKLIGQKKGAAFSHGRGTDEASAVVAAKADKQRRAAQNLRRERDDTGAVDQKPADQQSANRGGAAAGTQAGTEVKSQAHAISELTDAVRNLARNPTDENAHTRTRTILQSASDNGMDVAAIERAATERAGEGAGPVLAAAKSSEHPAVDTTGLDPATREAIDAAQVALERRPELKVEGENGEAVGAREALAKSMDDLSQAKQDGVLHQIAAACFGRG